MTVRIKKQESRLKHATLVSLDGIEFWSRPRYPDLPLSTGDIYHTVEAEQRIDTIARTYYKNEKLWWIIAHANNMFVLPCELEMGARIRIPDPRVVRKLLLI
jgi:nucleoid-associated protein YgaU